MNLIDISEWPSGNQRFVPIGKRIKKVVLHPETFDLYYFKEPKEKYPWEFWNEIIAYEIGKKIRLKKTQSKQTNLKSSSIYIITSR